MKALKKVWDKAVDFVEGEDVPGEVVYDPVHVAGVIVGSLCVMGFLFWLFWTLLVFEGGLPGKVVPFLQVLFTSKTFADFGYAGYPYQMGVFEGWHANLAALILGLGLLFGVWRVFHSSKGAK